jgi:ribosome-binding factor A
MPREFHRSRRVAEAIHRTLGEVLGTRMRDERLAGVTLTHVEVSRDLAVARVFYTLRGDDAQTVARALARAAGFMRREVAREIRLRVTPELRFVRDESLERGERLSALIDEARRRDRAGAPPGEAPDDATPDAGDD